MKRYNELLTMVKNSRNSSWRTRFEENLYERYRTNAENRLSAFKRKKKMEEAEKKKKKVRVMAQNMFDAMTL